ncbi:MAG TPA: ATP-dependent zinc metalloprotease FtsH [Mycobacteriales bacterium]|nr:ATP-dependent zinc metalloprotease FtsH [Mycobacteriales bacterium]
MRTNVPPDGAAPEPGTASGLPKPADRDRGSWPTDRRDPAPNRRPGTPPGAPPDLRPGGPAWRAGPPRRPGPAWRRWLVPVAMVLAYLFLVAPYLTGTHTASETYTQFVTAVDAGQVKQVSISDTGAVTGTLTSGAAFTSQLPTALDNTGLEQELRDHHVAITATTASTPWLSILLSFGPLILLVGFFLWTARRAARGIANGIGGFGRARTKVIDTERPTTRFADVAGYAGAKREVQEVVDYLSDPGRYAALGATGPRGVLLVGPPGTGKTLLARAVAGEAKVPFLPVSGSGFVELFVGIGASRVRDLFAEARRRAPAIIFIDEIDAIGGRRGAGLAGGNDEREQTLNQLLAEMDGFDQAPGVVILAATNRPETLDPALLRPGRFDRQVVVPLPTQADRAAILAVHTAGKPLAANVDLAAVARATPGFSGADLANLVNEAAIHAVRARRQVVVADDIDAARDRIMLGRREDSNVLLPAEKHAVAVHEAGHALVAMLSPHADPVAKVTILPAGASLGATHQLPEVERHLYRESYLLDVLAVRLGGRAAELVVFADGSTGAADDLASATDLALRMVGEFGLSARIGPVGYGDQTAHYLPGQPVAGRRYSEATQRLIDTEVAELLRAAEAAAVTLLRHHRPALDRITDLLVEHETLTGDQVRAALDEPPGTAPATAGPTPGAVADASLSHR